MKKLLLLSVFSGSTLLFMGCGGSEPAPETKAEAPKVESAPESSGSKKTGKKSSQKGPGVEGEENTPDRFKDKD